MFEKLAPEQCMFDVTYKCNLSCLHCYNNSGGEKNQIEELSDDKLLEICKDLAEIKTKNICFCGGETLLKQNFIKKATKLMKSIYPKIQVNMVTNGLLLTNELAKELKESGITLIQISLDGGTSNSHDWLRNKEGAFDSAVRALEILKKENIQSAVAFCPTTRNIEELETAADLCLNLGVKLFRLQPLMLIGRSVDYLQDYEMSYKEYRGLFNRIQQMKNNVKYKNMQFEWGDPIQFLTSYNIENMNNNTVLNINPYGDISVSPYLPITLGNVCKYSVKKYWESELQNVWKAQFLNDIVKIIEKNSSLNVNKYYKGLNGNILKIDVIDCDYVNMSLNALVERNKNHGN